MTGGRGVAQLQGMLRTLDAPTRFDWPTNPIALVLLSVALASCSDTGGSAGATSNQAGNASTAGASTSGGVGTAGATGAGGFATGGANSSGGSGSGGLATGGSAGSNLGGESAGGSNANGPRIATVAKPISLVPAPGLVGPALKVDLDMSGRPTSEVTELGYAAWPVTSGATLSQTFSNVTFTFAKAGSNGTGLAAGWQKVAVDIPNYARLVGDGVTVVDGDAGSQIQLTIKGLAAGKHSLLTFHNYAATTAPTAKIDVLVDGTAQVTALTQSVGALTTAAAAMSYVSFSAQAGKDVVVLFRSSAGIMLNGFELDTPNLAAQATGPVPADGDEHVDAEQGQLDLSWKAAKQATSHDVYLGRDPNAVQAATHASREFKGNQAGTSYTAHDLFSIERYYWRVDELDAQGVVTRGNVWYFRPRQVAFPGAGGYGRFAVGGRGGVVVHVTNLKDSGPGSLRDAIETDRGPRTVVFDVGGIIPLGSRLTLSQSYVTVAGQTAPGKGICVRAAPFGVSGAHDVVIRDMRVRVGHGTTYDGMGLAGADHTIIDHASISWTIDEAFSSRNAKNITLQRTLISEALNVAGHQNYPAGTAHGYAASIGGDIGSFHHNLLAHCEGRNWSLAGGLDAGGNFAGRLDIFNNVVYNWGGRATDGGAHQVNFVGNYYKPGAATSIFVALSAQYDDFPGTQQYYFAGNVMPGYFDESSQDKGKKAATPNGYSPWVDKAWFPSYAEVQTAKDAYKNVLSDVGATVPVFDDHDVRIVKETLNGTYTYKGSVSGDPGLPDNEADVGGYETYPNETRDPSWDSDGDALPDFWEKAAGLDVQSAAGADDANTDSDGDGYTELDEYLTWMATPHSFTSLGKTITVDLAKQFAGYTNGPTYAAAATHNGTLSISGNTATFQPTQCGLASWSIKVTDKDGSTMTRDWVASVDGGATACP